MGFVGNTVGYKNLFQVLHGYHHMGCEGGDVLAWFSSSPHFIFVFCLLFSNVGLGGPKTL